MFLELCKEATLNWVVFKQMNTDSTVIYLLNFWPRQGATRASAYRPGKNSAICSTLAQVHFSGWQHYVIFLENQ